MERGVDGEITSPVDGVSDYAANDFGFNEFQTLGVRRTEIKIGGRVRVRYVIEGARKKSILQLLREWEDREALNLSPKGFSGSRGIRVVEDSIVAARAKIIKAVVDARPLAIQRVESLRKAGFKRKVKLHTLEIA